MLMNKAANSQLVRKKSRTSFKEKVVQCADRDGVAKTAEDFGIPESTLEAWRENFRLIDEVAFLKMSAPYLPNKRGLSH